MARVIRRALRRAAAQLERMLRMYFVQHGSNLTDAACEDALPGSTALRRLVETLGFGKVHAGLAKNATRVFVATALANVFRACRRLLARVRLHGAQGEPDAWRAGEFASAQDRNSRDRPSVRRRASSLA
jgi:hypothetical protein